MRSSGSAGFLDNLVPFKGGLAGPQLAGWTPGPPARRGLGCRILADRMIPVADGVALAADVHLPKPEGRYPAVIAFSAYSKELQASGAPTGTNETGSPPVFTDRGYAHIIVARRGMGRSQGQSLAFFDARDVEDHAMVIAWAAAQPWCDGQVVLFGTSYYGIVQPQVARLHPPALKGFFAIEFCTDYFRHVAMYGGGPQADFLTLWMGANFTPSQFALRVPPLLRAVASQLFNSPLKRWWWPFLQERMARLMKRFETKTPTPAMRDLLAGILLDGKTRATSPLPAGPSGRLGDITLPFVAVQNPGFLNLHQFGAYDLFENAGTDAADKWLIIAPAAYELPAYHWQLEALAFFDYLLLGADNGYDAQARVRYWTEGAGDYRGAADFPVPGSEAVRFYPAPSQPGGADAAMHRLTGTPPQGGSNRWAAVPRGAVVPPGFDEAANPMLSFEATIQGDTEFTGPVTANLVFSSNEIDSHVVARTGVVAPDGRYRLLSIGTLRAACRRVDEARSTRTEIAIDIDRPEPLLPGEPVTLRFSLTPQPVMLKAGEKLRLDIASRVDLLRGDPGHDHPQFDMQVPPYFARNTLHYGPDTYLELRRVPNRAAD